jgi:hypothetical protein
MDASDVLRKLRSQTTFEYYKQKIAVTQPLVNLSTCGSVSSIKIVYPTYEQRDLVTLGKFYTNSCSTVGTAGTSIEPIQGSGNTSYRPKVQRYDAPVI